MPKFLVKFILNGFFVFLLPYVIPGIKVANFYVALVVVAVLAVTTFFLRPLLQLLTLPINCLTFGFFTLIINGAIFWFVSTIVKGFYVQGILAAFLGALVLAVLQTALDWALEGKENK